MEIEKLPDLDLQELKEYLETRVIEGIEGAAIVDNKDLKNNLLYISDQEMDQVNIEEGLTAYSNLNNFTSVKILKEGHSFYINEINFRKALQLGEEFLILAYSPMHQMCLLSNVAKAFVLTVDYYMDIDNKLVEKLSYLVEVTKPTCIHLTDQIFLIKGHWLIEIRNAEPFIWKSLDPVDFEKIKEKKKEQLESFRLGKTTQDDNDFRMTYWRW